MEHITALLDIRDTAFPKEVKQINLADRYITEAIELGVIPKDSVYTSTCLELIVPYIGVGLLKLVLVKHHRDNR